MKFWLIAFAALIALGVLMGGMMTRHDISWWLHLHWPDWLPNWIDRPLARLAWWLNV